MKTGLDPAVIILEKQITFRNEIFKNFRWLGGSFFCYNKISLRFI